MKSGILLALAVASTAVSAFANVQAPDVTFARFGQTAGTPAKPFVFVNDGGAAGAATFNTVGGAAGIAVDFEYLNTTFTGALASLNGAQMANLVMTSSTATDAEAVAGHPGWYDQSIDSGSLVFKLQTPVDGKATLLQVAFQLAELETFKRVATEIADDFADFCSDNCTSITYTSDFLTFAVGGSESWVVGFTGVAPAPVGRAANGVVDDFRADGAGEFAYSGTFQVIPEPGTYAALVGAAALAFAALRRRAGAQAV